MNDETYAFFNREDLSKESLSKEAHILDTYFRTSIVIPGTNMQLKYDTVDMQLKYDTEGTPDLSLLYEILVSAKKSADDAFNELSVFSGPDGKQGLAMNRIVAISEKIKIAINHLNKVTIKETI